VTERIGSRCCPGVYRLEAAARKPVAAPALNDAATFRALVLGHTEEVLALTADNERLGAKVVQLAPNAAAHDLMSVRDGASGHRKHPLN
jgi:hypothetical protein